MCFRWSKQSQILCISLKLLNQLNQLNFQMVYCVTALIWFNLSFVKIAVINLHALIYLFWCQKTHQKSWFHHSIPVFLSREKWKSFSYLLSWAFSGCFGTPLVRNGMKKWGAGWKSQESLKNASCYLLLPRLNLPWWKLFWWKVITSASLILWKRSIKIWDATVNIPQLNW